MTSDLSQIGFLLFVSALVAMLSRRMNLPYTVGLVLAGMALYLAHVYIKLQLSKELIFSVFLPPLVFEAALFIPWREFKRDLPLVGFLASVGVLLAAALTATGLYYGLDWDWGSATIFGILIAATDPVSVIATFKESAVPARLRLLLEAESLLNDGTAAVAFVVVLGILAGGSHGVATVAVNVLLTTVGAVVVGGAVGAALMLLAGRTPDYLVELTFTTLSAYGSFYIAEHYHMSGVLATLTSGFVVGSFHSSKWITRKGQHALEPFWEYAAFVANSLIFLLIGAEEAQQRFDHLWAPAVLAIVLVLGGRAVAIYPLCAIFAATRLKVDLRQQHVLWWGGLRGALALALALALPMTVKRRADIITLTFAVVAFSVFVQGLSVRPMLRGLRLIDPSARPSARGREHENI